MTREIKFRVWDKIRRKIYYEGKLENGMQFVLDLNGELLFEDEKKFKQIDFIIMQYTGLIDREGKEIYEGDILKHISYYDLFEVHWGYCSFGLNNISEGTTAPNFLVSCLDKLKVIGNIYENTELLGKN